MRSIDAVESGLASAGYIASRPIATAVYLAEHLGKPILVEGPAGVGKTDLANATARFLGLPLIRLQCYDGLDESKALYEWKYGKQLLYTQILKDTLGATLADAGGLEPRPLLRALQAENGAVLLIDEIDKAEAEFEAFLLEVLSDFAVTVPEIGTIAAVVPPLVVLTSNDTRDLGDALKRRCLHLHIDFPDARLEERIVAVRVPDVDARLRTRLVAFVQHVRTLELKKVPSISETIDWARALLLLHANELGPDIVRDTLNVLLKFEIDVAAVTKQLPALLRAADPEAGAA